MTRLLIPQADSDDSKPRLRLELGTNERSSITVVTRTRAPLTSYTTQFPR